MKSLKNEQGFTLVELMVVVAIIGILSAVAIPNFKKYQAKSKQSEAKLQLASIFTAETTLMADYDSFGHCLAFAGYAGPAANNYYGVGFRTDNAASQALIVGNGGAGCAGGAGASWWTANKTVRGNRVDTQAEIVASTVAATGVTFIAGASGWISADAAVADDWTINENKILTNVAVGI